MSLVITRNNDHIAIVTSASQATALADLSSIKVSGNLSGTAGLQGYLEIEWEYPTELQAGVYTCEANALTSFGHSKVFTEDLTINFTQPTLIDAVRRKTST
jgi:hypothetical protein